MLAIRLLTLAAAALRCTAHPMCLDGMTPPLQVAIGKPDYRKDYNAFCSKKVMSAKFTTLELDDGTCCNYDRDVAIKATYMSDLANANVTAASTCGQLHASLLCSECHPFAGHLYEKNPANLQVDLSQGGVLLINSTYLQQWQKKCVGKSYLLDKYNGTSSLLKAVPGFANDGTFSFPYAPVWFWGTGGAGEQPDRVFTRLVLPPIVMQIRMRPDTNAWWVVTKEGHISEFVNDPLVTTTTEVLDISFAVVMTGGEGLMDVSFDPNFATNKVFYVFYCYVVGAVRWTRLARFVLMATPTDTKKTELSVMDIKNTDAIHKSGAMAWLGDELYLAQGDSGADKNIFDLAQKDYTLLGKIMRMKIDPVTGNFTGTGFGGPSNLVIAKGVRNPHKMTLDTLTNELWIGDVGQAQREEVSMIKTTVTTVQNLGWPIWEGKRCNLEANNEKDLQYCASLPYSSTVAPIYDWCHERNKSMTQWDMGPCDELYIGSTSIGGYVYRGKKYKNLYGHYVYLDYRNQEANVLLLDRETVPGTTLIKERQHLQPVTVNPASLAVDKDGEIYFVTHKEKTPSVIYTLSNCGPLCS